MSRAGVDKKQDFYKVSPENNDTLWDDLNQREGVYNRELRQLRSSGFIDEGDYLKSPK